MATGFTFLRSVAFAFATRVHFSLCGHTGFPIIQKTLCAMFYKPYMIRHLNDITATELPLDQPSKASCQLAITNHRGKHYLSSRLSYHANSSSTFQLTRLSTSGDINPNPGLAAEENTTTNCALCVPEPSPVTIESSTGAYARLWAVLSAQKSPHFIHNIFSNRKDNID